METINLQKEDVITAYNEANEEGKKLLKNLFSKIDFTPKDDRPVTERVKTFEDACNELCKNNPDHPFVLAHDFITNELGDGASHDLVAYLKLRVIVAALNEGWEPQFTEGEYRWYPWYYLYKSKEEYEAESESWKEKHPLVLFGGFALIGARCGFVSSLSNNAPSHTIAIFGSRLCLQSEALADYCGKQFADLWADFYLIRKTNDTNTKTK